jgi:putative spermidine/putrescine transport system permease protein
VTELPRQRFTQVVLVGLFVVPLAVIALQAVADSWRAPSLLPQQLGWRGFEVAFGTGGAASATVTSLAVALLTTAICLLVGWPAARALGGRLLPRNGLIALLIALPLLMPTYLAGFGLTEWFIRLGIDGTLAGLVLAHVVLALPYAILILLSGFNRAVDELEEMASTTGAGPVRRLLWVTLPSMRPALGAAALLSFLVSWSQYGSSLAVGAGRSTLPIVMLPFVRSDPQVGAALAVVFVVPALIALAFAARSQRSPL